jgi:hypothetical protein
MKQPTFKRVMTGHYFTLGNKIHRGYIVRVTWPDNRSRLFASEELAEKYVEEEQSEKESSLPTV